jgi:polyisoprenoid-binding protein YceI
VSHAIQDRANSEEIVMKVRVLSACAALTVLFVSASASRGQTLAPGSGAAAALQGGRPSSAERIRLVTAPEGNRARYRVREQLAGLQFPNDAVGETGAITGTLTLEADGKVVREESRFVVDLTKLKSDKDRRDGYVQRNTLQTAEFPTAVFVPTAIHGLPSPLPTTGEMTLRMEGELTLHGVTRPTAWDVTLRAANGTFTGQAATVFTFDAFGLSIPKVASVLSVVDEIRLEYDLHLVPAPRTAVAR